MVECAPPSIDLQDFQFKLHSKCKIFDNNDDGKFKKSFSLVCAASRYGLVIIGSSNATLEIVQLKSIENVEKLNVKSESVIAKRSILLPSNATHVSLNCDQSFLAVVCVKNDCVTVLIYKVFSLISQNVEVIREIRLSSTPGVEALETSWNPTVPSVYTTCKSDGSLGVYTVQEKSVDINELPVAAAARCFCWSPKGKQLVVGAANGSLCQYKPDLKAVKVIQPPPLSGTGPFAAINVFWLTNYQFVAVYKNVADEDARPSILIVNAPKVGNIAFINYEDICYSYGSLRPPQYYIVHQPTWGVLLVASANSMEIGVLGVSQAGEPAVWQQWNQLDSARAELPLSANHQETFPVGFAFDTGVTMQLQWGENQMLPSMPMIHILSHHGLLCSFSVINLREGADTLCAPPENIPDQSGINKFIIQPAATQPSAIKVASPPASTAVTKPLFPPPTLQFGTTPSNVSSTGNLIMKPTAQQPQPQPQLASASQNILFETPPSTTGKMFAGGVNLFGATPMFTPPITSHLVENFALKPSTSLTTGSSSSFSSVNTTTGAFSLSISSKPLFTNVPSSMTPVVKPTFNLTASPVVPSTPPKNVPPQFNKLSSQMKQAESTPNDSITAVNQNEKVNNEMIQNRIKEEMNVFQSELQSLLGRCKNLKLDVGSEEEKSNLVVTTESLMEFNKELQDITDSQVAEVHYLKQALMQSFAWYEDTKARHKRYTDPDFATLFQSQKLDPVSDKQIADISHLLYYIEAQLKQADEFLDDQWADFQDSCKKQIKGKLQIPTLEPVYQTMVRLNATLDRQKYILKDIEVRIKSRNKKSANSRNVLNKVKNSISIEEKMNKLKLDQDDVFASRYEKITANEKKFTNKKQSKLCDFFTSRSVVHISPKKPKFVDNVFQNSPSKLNSSLTTVTPGVQRSLRSTFDQIAEESRLASPLNTSVEANLSATNVFSFTLLDGKQSVPKLKTPEAPKQKIDITASASLGNSAQSSLFSTALGSSGIFNFTALTTATTTTTTIQSRPPTFPSISTNTSPKPNLTFNFQVNNKSDNVVTKPTNVKSTLSDTIIKSSESEIQPFTFAIPQSKTAAINKAAGDSSSDQRRNSLEPSFNFGNALSLGQQSTPKPKFTSTFGQMLTTKTNILPGITTSVSASTGVQTTKPTLTTATTISVIKPQVSITLTVAPSSSTLTVTTTSSNVITPIVSINLVNNNSKVDSSTGSILFGGGASIATQSMAQKMAFNFEKPAAPIPNAEITTTASIFPTATPSAETLASAEIRKNSFSFLPTTSSSPTTSAPKAKTGSIFGTPAAADPDVNKQFSIFGSTAEAPNTKPAEVTKTPSLFDAANIKNIANSQKLAFGFTSEVPHTSLFESTPNTGSIFATATATTNHPPKESSTSASIFAQSAPTIFGGKSPSGSVPTSNFSFVQNASPVTTAAISFSFVQPVATTAPESVSPKTTSIFGTATTSTNSGSGFGTTATTNSFSFSNLTISALSPSTSTPTTLTNTNTFNFALPASSTTSTFSTSNVFEKPASTATASSFIGQPICSPSSFSSSNQQQQQQQQQSSGTMFGQSTPATNIFAMKSSNSNNNSPSTEAIFGQNTGSIFGGSSPAVSSGSTSIFGQTQSSPFGSTATSGGSIFGQPSAFGQPSSFGTTQQPFTQQQQPQTGSSGFGSSSGSIFGVKQTTTFGATQPPAFGQTSSFGSPPAFGATANSSGNAFGSPTPANTSGTFGSGFGSPSTFGQKPAFGSPPSFGQQNSGFGSSPTFGGSPAFGSPPRIFGTTAPPTTGTFGTTVQENSTFANLATQSTLGFGNLAQNQAAAPPQQPHFSGGTQFTSWR